MLPLSEESTQPIGLVPGNRKQALKPLPLDKYELKEYKIATVQKNCHVFMSRQKLL
jgi:hypothetical protein